MKSMVGQNILSQEKTQNFEVSETTLTNYDDSAVPISSKLNQGRWVFGGGSVLSKAENINDADRIGCKEFQKLINPKKDKIT